jgi:hypothetical protein
MDVFPTTPSVVYTIAGAAALGVLITAWLKKFLPDWRYTPLLCLGITFVLVEIAGGAFVHDVDIWERLYTGFLVALGGASLATFGREGLLNILGVAGVGARSDARLDAQARERVSNP